MAEKDTISNPKRFFILWGMILAVVFLATIAGNFALAMLVKTRSENDPRLHILAAQKHLAEKRYSDARLEIDRALVLIPTSPEPYMLSGHLHYDAQQWEDAIADYRTAIGYGSGDQYVDGRILWCLIHLRRFDEAAEYGRASLASGRGTSSLNSDTAEAYRRAGKLAEAKSFFEMALSDSPGSVDLMERLKGVCQAMGDQQEVAAIQSRIDGVRSTLEAPSR